MKTKILLLIVALLSFVIIPTVAEAKRGYSRGSYSRSYKSSPSKSYKQKKVVPKKTPAQVKADKAKKAQQQKAKKQKKEAAVKKKEQERKAYKARKVRRNSYADRYAGGGFWSNPITWMFAYFWLFSDNDSQKTTINQTVVVTDEETAQKILDNPKSVKGLTEPKVQTNNIPSPTVPKAVEKNDNSSDGWGKSNTDDKW